MKFVDRAAAIWLAAAVAWSWVVANGSAAQVPVQTHDERDCACDPARPETLQARQCALCREAERQPQNTPFFYLKDSNPRKPNRWLILPRAHGASMHSLADLTPEASALFWKAAIEKAQSLWGVQWGLAVNGDRARTQCHAHVHIGKLMDNTDGGEFLLNAGAASVQGKPPIVLQSPEQIQASRTGEAFWIHPVGKVLHLHVEDTATAAEFVLMR